MFKTISGIVLVSAFIFAGKVLLDIHDFASYDSKEVVRDLLWATSCGIFIILIIPIIRVRVLKKNGK